VYIKYFYIFRLLMYYFWLLGQGYKRREEILSEQLKMVGSLKMLVVNVYS